EREHAAGGMRFDADLRDPRKVTADLVAIFGRIGTEPMKPELLVKVGVLLGALAITRVAGVINSSTVRRPGRITAGRGDLNTADRPIHLFAGVNVENVEVADLRPGLGHRHGYQTAVERRPEPVDGTASTLAKEIRVEYYPAVVGPLRIFE